MIYLYTHLWVLRQKYHKETLNTDMEWDSDLYVSVFDAFSQSHSFITLDCKVQEENLLNS
jgi:hypothetical protein